MLEEYEISTEDAQSLCASVLQAKLAWLVQWFTY